jgi:hypothetical protein
MMTQAKGGPLQLRYWEAIRRKVCAVCLDVGDDGSCRLSGGRVCGVEEHLPRLVSTLRGVRSNRLDEYVAAVEAEVCVHCRQDEDRHCALRAGAECALYAYLPLVLEAIEEVDARTA